MSEDRNERGRFVEKVTLGDTLTALTERNEPVTAGEVGDDLGVSSRAALNKLNELAERGDVERKKVGGRSVVWWIPEEDESAFARDLSRKAIAEQYGDDYFAENPGWADGLEDLGENA